MSIFHSSLEVEVYNLSLIERRGATILLSGIGTFTTAPFIAL